MITKSERKKLNYLLEEVRLAEDLINRFSSGLTNKSHDEVTAETVKARTGLKIFLDSITEK